MKKVLAWPAMYTCFWLGHFVSKLMHCEPLGRMYPVYNRLMMWSVDLNDWAGFDLWKPPQSDAASKPAACEMCGDAPCQGCNRCCGSKLGRDPEDGSCLGCG